MPVRASRSRELTDRAQAQTSKAPLIGETITWREDLNLYVLSWFLPEAASECNRLQGGHGRGNRAADYVMSGEDDRDKERHLRDSGMR